MMMQSTTDCIDLLFKGKLNETLLSQEKLVEKANSFEAAGELEKFVNDVQQLINEAAKISDDKELMKKREYFERALPKVETELLKRPSNKVNAAGVEKVVSWSLIDGLSGCQELGDSVDGISIHDLLSDSSADLNTQLNTTSLAINPQPPQLGGGISNLSSTPHQINISLFGNPSHSSQFSGSGHGVSLTHNPFNVSLGINTNQQPQPLGGGGLGGFMPQPISNSNLAGILQPQPLGV